MKRLLVALLGIAALSVAVATFLPLLWRIVPRASILVALAPQIAAAAALLAVIALLARRRAFATLCVVCAAWNVQTIWPDVSPFRALPSVDGRPVLKVVNLNLWFHNKNIDQTADYLLASGADVIGLVEARPNLKEGLSRLKTVYPYSVDCVGSLPKCQTMLFSKYPLKNAHAGPIDGRFPYIAIAQVEMPGGVITVAVTHLNTPFVTKTRAPLATIDSSKPVPELSGVPALEQSRQAANLASFLANQPADLVLLGDFNSASWSPIQEALRTATGLDNRGHLLPSWPSWAWPIFRLPIDQVFVRGKLQVTQIAVGPDIGSDHLPVEAEIAVLP